MLGHLFNRGDKILLALAALAWGGLAALVTGRELGPFEPDRETAEVVHFGLTFARGVDEEPIDFLDRSMRRLHG
jgi:hypothetical protein